MFFKNKKFWIVLILLIVILGVSYCLYVFILYDDEITESKGVIEITFEGKPVNITDMVTISFTESDFGRPITVENTGKKIYLGMNTWEKADYKIRILVDSNVLGTSEEYIEHIFSYYAARVDISVMLDIKINYYNSNNNWYADINYTSIEDIKLNKEQTFLLTGDKKTYLRLGP